jgi:hypothetical protein
MYSPRSGKRATTFAEGSKSCSRNLVKEAFDMAKKKDGGAKGIGRWVPIGMKTVTAEWKAVNPKDDNLIFLLDSASGQITVCGDTSGVRAGIGPGALVAPAPARRRRKARAAG